MNNITEICERLNIQELNAMQRETKAKMLDTDLDVVVISPTGSGKTLAYMLPLVNMLDVSTDNLQTIVIVPNRELALQSASVLESMKTGVRFACCYGGRPAMDEHKTLLRIKPHVIFGTPGRLNDHIDKGNISSYTVRYAVIDEFDKCLEMGFHKEMSYLLKKLSGVRRRFLLSATNTEQIPDFVRLNKTLTLDYSSPSISSRVSLYELKSTEKDKVNVLVNLLCVLGSQSSIIFLNYRDGVERVANALKERGFSISSFHGGMEQTAREEALYKYSNGSANIFVSTDLASRGLDIPNIDNIIHYHLPQTKESYIHRVGRTARWNAEGRTFFVLGPEENTPDFVDEKRETFIMPEEIPAPTKSKMVTIYIGKGKKDKISKGDIVGFLCKKGGLEQREIGRVDVKERYAYAAVPREKLHQVLSQTSDGRIKGVKTVVEIVK